mmetsp:Transcript_22087/g.51342  ORF Transcript_22087/g.51342 Transcript_22087/m.51342 type:complete len:108 (+) Transcript_22087:319-642(+)
MEGFLFARQAAGERLQRDAHARSEKEAVRLRCKRCYAKYDPPPPGETVLSGYIRRDGLIYRCNWVGRRLTLLDFQPSDSYFCPDDDDHLGSLAWKVRKSAEGDPKAA